MPYFWRPKPVGLKTDIAQHRAEQAKLEGKISELEALPSLNAMQCRALSTYRYLLAQLLQSKADTVSKIGKKALD